MSTFLRTYDPEQVVIVLNEEPVVGFADGEMVTVEKNGDFFFNMVGTKGEVSRAMNRDNTGTITLRLQHTSPFIERIQQYAFADNFGGVPPILGFRIYDPSSNDQLLATQVWLNTDASHTWGNEVGVREYQFFAVNVVTPANVNIAPRALGSLINGIGG